MAFPSNIIKLTFGGSLFSTNEIWQCGLSLAKPGTNFEATQAQIDTLAESLGVVVDGYFTAVGKYLNKSVELQWTKVAELGPDGKYTADSAAVHTTQPAIKGGGQNATGGQATMPNNNATLPQAAIVITLDAKIRGKRGRLSRFYLPMPVAVIDGATGRAPAMAGAFLEDSAGFINTLNVEAQKVISGLVVVAASSLGEGVINEVLEVRIGDVVDTMRSRRNGLREIYSVAPVTPIAAQEEPAE